MGHGAVPQLSNPSMRGHSPGTSCWHWPHMAACAADQCEMFLSIHTSSWLATFIIPEASGKPEWLLIGKRGASTIYSIVHSITFVHRKTFTHMNGHKMQLYHLHDLCRIPASGFTESNSVSEWHKDSHSTQMGFLIIRTKYELYDASSDGTDSK